MRILLRKGVFETSSSSVSAFAYVSPETWDKWKSGEYCIDFAAIASEYEEDYIPDLMAYDAERHLIKTSEVEKMCEQAEDEAKQNEWHWFSKEGFMVSSGLLPYDIIDEKNPGQIKTLWAGSGGGITRFDLSRQPDGGMLVELERYDW